ncbi:serine/threonine protein kinase [Enhygromyxa salina]|uniref:Serine/threonine protein kinase n=1 Tax=Enhygromyxa salina TaxID=215803 RepID=A0A0C1ZDY5_9BACT|nr:protein kinase [Enhygromyxa salina]KIG15869.1 serine/threonine protein kinase [Enhygromyxa salina]
MFPPDQTAELSTPAGRKPARADVAAAAADSIADGRSQHRAPTKVGVWEEGAIINDRYTLERRLGSGSMGEVFLASDRLLKKHVALKVLRGDMAKSRATVRRFLREVALAHSVTHPNVVRIYDTGETDGLPYFSMEHLQGQTLEQLIDVSRVSRGGRGNNGDADDSGSGPAQATGQPTGVRAREVDGGELGDPPMTLREIREISYEILSGLAAAHAAGIVHRDLKPANVMLTHRGAIVMDFGVAGFDSPTPGVRPNPAEARSLVRTEAGTIFGSPAYMAPELWEGAPATVQSDLYSFGVMLYQMLSGRLPIEAPNAKVFLIKLKEEKPPPIRQLRKDTPWNLALLVSRCMSSDPEQRPISANAAANLVSPLAKRWRWIIAAGVLAITLGLISLGLRSAEERRYLDMGLPDAIAAADLDAFVRSFDVGDHASAVRQIERLEVRAPDSAAVVYWRATLEHALGNEPRRWDRCQAAGYTPDGAGEQWRGSADWRELAMGACSASYSLSSELRALLDPSKSSNLPDAWLPLAVNESLVPRIEAARDLGPTLRQEAQDVLQRLDEAPDLEDGPPLAIHWQLARFELHVALGRFDEARNLLDDLLTGHPEAPIVLARAAQFYALSGEIDRANEWAKRVEDYDPRPTMRLLLDAGRLNDATVIMDRYATGPGPHPLQQWMLDSWCGYAYRFELDTAPERCGAVGPGLVHNMWIAGRLDGADQRAMSTIEREIASAQVSIDRRECWARGIQASVVTHTVPPFETYLRQLDIYAALCFNGGDARPNPKLARRLADDLVSVAPGDPWALLVDAQVDDALLASATATNKRREVLERWRQADADLPLVRTLRKLVGEPAPTDPTDPTDASEPDSELDPQPDREPGSSEPTLMTPVGAGEPDHADETDDAGEAE